MRLAPLVLALVVVTTAARADELTKKTWTVAGVEREALVHAPAAAITTETPVLFAFHGHGGTHRHAARTWGFHEKWPEAIVVYPQGLPTPGQLTDPEGKKAGWQKTPGDQGDRDLAFVDAILESLKKDYKVDARRIFSTGHSNGGGFTYLLWAARGDVFTAFAPSAAGPGRNGTALKARPALHLAGQKDPLVRFTWQEATMKRVRELNGVGEGKPWKLGSTLYPSDKGTPFVAFIHEGGHEFPEKGADLIVAFFQNLAELGVK